MEFVVLITVVALLQFLYFGVQVGRARGRFNVDAPATSGHPEFERYFRVHMNTLEQLAMFLPSLWMFGTYVSSVWAAGLGAVFIAGRAIFARSYVREPKSRSLGFALSALPSLVMLVGLLIWAVHGLIMRA